MIDTKKLPRPQVPVESDPYRERARIKRTLAASFRLFAHYGFEQGVMGHISARDPIEPETIWMNSFAQGFATITADSLLRVDFSGRIVEGEGHVHPGGINTHVGIYQANRHLNGVAHAHTDHSIAWSALDKTFEPISAESAALYGKHALYDTYAHGEGEQLARIVETNRVVIFRSHGIFTAGESVEEAVYLFILADKVSHVHLLVEATGKAPVRIPPDIAQAISRNNDASKSRLNFQPYLQAALARWPDLNK